MKNDEILELLELFRRRPKNLVIDFSTSSNVLQGAGSAAIVDGKLIITPSTTGSELVANGGFASDTTGWTPVNSNLTSVSGGQAGNCLNIENSTTSSGIAVQQTTTAVDSWYLFSAYHKNGTSSGIIRLATTSSGSDIFNGSSIFDATWANKLVSFRGISTSTYIRLITNSSTAGNSTQFDTVTLMQLAFQTLFRGKQFSTQYGVMKAGWNITAGTPAGVYMCMDSLANPQNMVSCIHNGTNLILSKRVAGTVTELINTAATYSAGASVEIRRAAGTNTFKAYYNNSQVGTDQTITDASVINNRIHGLFNSHQQNQALTFSFIGA